MEGFRAHCLTGSLSAMDKPVVRDAALLIFRATLGLIFVAHGWQKLFMDGPVETAVHLNSGLFIADGGFEYVLVLIVSLLMIVVFGSGRASIDGVLSR